MKAGLGRTRTLPRTAVPAVLRLGKSLRAIALAWSLVIGTLVVVGALTMMPWLARLAMIAGSRLSDACREAATQRAPPIATATNNARPPSRTRRGTAPSRLAEEVRCTVRPLLSVAAPRRLAGLDHQLDFRDFNRMSVAVGGLVLEIPQTVPVAPRFGLMLVLKWFSQPVPVMGAVAGPLGVVGHDDVRVTVRLFTGAAVCMLDDLHQPVSMRIRPKIMPVDVFVIVPVRHRPILQVDGRSGQAAARQ